MEITLERLLEGFKENVSQGMECELRFDGHHVTLWAHQAQALVGFVLAAKGQKGPENSAAVASQPAKQHVEKPSAPTAAPSARSSITTPPAGPQRPSPEPRIPIGAAPKCTICGQPAELITWRDKVTGEAKQAYKHCGKWLNCKCQRGERK